MPAYNPEDQMRAEAKRADTMDRPKTVLELFEGHPERRMTGGALAADEHGSCSPFDERACRWTLEGAAFFVYYRRPEHAEVFRRLKEYLGTAYPDSFNDFAGHTQVVNACRELGI